MNRGGRRSSAPDTELSSAFVLRKVKDERTDRAAAADIKLGQNTIEVVAVVVGGFRGSLRTLHDHATRVGSRRRRRRNCRIDGVFRISRAINYKSIYFTSLPCCWMAFRISNVLFFMFLLQIKSI